MKIFNILFFTIYELIFDDVNNDRFVNVYNFNILHIMNKYNIGT